MRWIFVLANENGGMEHLDQSCADLATIAIALSS